MTDMIRLRKSLTAILLMSVTFSGVWAEDMREMFKAMPDSVLPLLSEINRLDMIDFIDGGMKAAVRNRLDGMSELEYIDGRYLRMKYTSRSDVEMRLFHYRDSVPLICVVHTVESGLHDSRVRFYDSEWRPVDSRRILVPPVLDDFLSDGLKRDSIASFRTASEIRSVRASLSPESDWIAFEYTGLGFLNTDSVRYAGYVGKSPLNYVWDGKRFRKSGKGN